MKNQLFLSVLLLLMLLTVNQVFSQTDVGPETRLGVTAMYGITSEEAAQLQNQVNIERNIPADLLEQMNQAKLNEDVDEIARLQIEFDKYSAGTYKTYRDQNLAPQLTPVPGTSATNPTSGPDWSNNDITVYSGSTANYQRRTLDMKMGEDGNLYLAHIVSQASDRRINVYQSTDGGHAWTLEGFVYYPSNNAYFQTISMLVERRSSTNDDSTRVIVYYTRSANTNNDDASLGFFSFKPNAATPDYKIATIESPTSGNQFNYVSAFSDGAYYSTATWMGVVVGEYSNANGDSAVSLRYFRTTDWGASHTGVTLNTSASSWDDLYPSAAFMGRAGGVTPDTVLIAVERRFSGQTHIRIIKTPYTPASTFSTIYLTSNIVDYERPVLNIKQDAEILPKSMIITCTKDHGAVYHSSLDNGATWGTDYILDQRTGPPQTTNYTWVSSDSISAGGGNFVAVFANTDSLNVRRGVNGSLGLTSYLQNSSSLTGTAFPVCAIYRDPTATKYSAVAYWGFGPTNVLYDGEQLPTGITKLTEVANSYRLTQNNPNPFNPTTQIEFTVPSPERVTITLYDILGKKVATIVDRNYGPGTYNVSIDGSRLSSGNYFYQMEAGDFRATKKMLLLK